jgi:hypothetical protein
VTDPGKNQRKDRRWINGCANMPAQFGLTGEEGNPVNQAIEECSKSSQLATGKVVRPSTPGA